jgi:hypothetical protein
MNCPSCNLDSIENIDGFKSCTNCGWIESAAFEDCFQDAGISRELQKSIADLRQKEESTTGECRVQSDEEKYRRYFRNSFSDADEF